jgi:hypothetical protein
MIFPIDWVVFKIISLIIKENFPPKRFIIRKKVDINNSHLFSKIKKAKRKKREKPRRVFVGSFFPIFKIVYK